MVPGYFYVFLFQCGDFTEKRATYCDFVLQWRYGGSNVTLWYMVLCEDWFDKNVFRCWLAWGEGWNVVAAVALNVSHIAWLHAFYDKVWNYAIHNCWEQIVFIDRNCITKQAIIRSSRFLLFRFDWSIAQFNEIIKVYLQTFADESGIFSFRFINAWI